MPERADRPSMIGRTDSLSTILNDRHAEIQQRIQIRRQAEEVRHDNGSCAAVDS